MTENIEVIAFDGDHTLWENECYFQEAEQQFCSLLEGIIDPQELRSRLFATEMKNLSLYGYGVKGFVLCMIETLSDLGAGLEKEFIPRIIQIGQELLNRPVFLLPKVKTLLEDLHGIYRLVLATKGDLLDQERKLQKSGLKDHFHHIQIMSNKAANDYRSLLMQMDCAPERFLMVGNSVKSDILPVLDINGWAVHVPYHLTWMHEVHTGAQIQHPKFFQALVLSDLLNYIPS